jgi:hypothetical protein
MMEWENITQDKVHHTHITLAFLWTSFVGHVLLPHPQYQKLVIIICITQNNRHDDPEMFKIILTMTYLTETQPKLNPVQPNVT